MTEKKRPGGDPPGSAVSEDGLVGEGAGSGSGRARGTVGPIVPGDAAADDATALALARLTDGDLPAAEKRRALNVVVDGLRRRGFADIVNPRAVMAWVGDAVVDVAPRIPMRSLGTLRAHHSGLSDEEIGDRLVRNAGRTSAGIGALGGGVTSVQWLTPPALLSAPAVLAAETIAVVAVEIKLIGELQELYGHPVQGSVAQRGISLLQAWAGRRGVSLLVPGRSVAAVLGTAARHELRDRLVRRFGRNLTTLGPLLTGAAVAALLNRRATLKLAAEVRADLIAKGVVPE